LQKWLGHAQLSTTAIYADAIGEEAEHRRVEW
jgi:site-specific recombinase XerD